MNGCMNLFISCIYIYIQIDDAIDACIQYRMHKSSFIQLPWNISLLLFLLFSLSLSSFLAVIYVDVQCYICFALTCSFCLCICHVKPKRQIHVLLSSAFIFHRLPLTRLFFLLLESTRYERRAERCAHRFHDFYSLVGMFCFAFILFLVIAYSLQLLETILSE